MKLNRILILIVILALCGCTNQPEDYPKETDFSIETIISNTSPKLGEEILINTTFKNKTKYKYEIERGPDLITVHCRKVDDQIDMLFGGPGYTDVINASYTYEDLKKIKIEEPGKYKITVAAHFGVEINNKYQNYTIKTEAIIMDVTQDGKSFT